MESSASCLCVNTLSAPLTVSPCAQINGTKALFDFGSEIIPGVVGINAPWHTPGMTVYKLSLVDGEPPLIVTGDAFSHVVLSIENPWFLSAVRPISASGPLGSSHTEQCLQ